MNFLVFHYSQHENEQQRKRIDEIRAAIQEQRPTKVSLTNYRKNGESFTNLLSMKPVLDEDGRVKYFLSVQFDLDTTRSQHRIAQLNSFFEALPCCI